MPTTSSPLSSNFLAKLKPINPAVPVIKTFKTISAYAAFCPIITSVLINIHLGLNRFGLQSKQKLTKKEPHLVFEAKYPILGFENVHSYDFEVVDDNFATIKNAEGGMPAFTLVNPFVLRDYAFDVPVAVRALMDLTHETNMLIYLVLIVKKPFKESLANFLAPVILNVDNKTMAQVVLDESIYTDYLAAEPLSKFITE